MPYYFMRDTPLQALEQLMMSQPGQKPRGGGIYLSPFHYTPKDVACEYCQNYVRKHPCRLCECTCLEERIEAGVLELNAFMRDCFTPSTVTMGAAHPTCIPCSKAAKKRSPPPREDCAFLLDPGEVHDGPPRRTHSTGDLIQRKNSGIVAEYRIYFNIEMGQAASVYTCYLPCRNRYFFFMDRSSIYPRLPRGSN